jgi:hypothetical protein
MTFIFYVSFQGITGFWRGVTASYWGISETVIHFVVYEYLKSQLAAFQNKHKNDEKTFYDFIGFMACGACSKTCATVVAYPHGKRNRRKKMPLFVPAKQKTDLDESN